MVTTSPGTAKARRKSSSDRLVPGVKGLEQERRLEPQRVEAVRRLAVAGVTADVEAPAPAALLEPRRQAPEGATPSQRLNIHRR